MAGPVVVMSIAEVELIEAGIGREGRMRVKQFPLDTGVPGCGMEFSWNAYDKGYGTPRHRHTFDQFRYALEGPREIKDGFLQPGDLGFYPEGVHYGPQLQTMPSAGLGLQFEGASGLPYMTHDDLRDAKKKLEKEGGTFANGVYTKIQLDGRKFNQDGHAACYEYLTGRGIEYPEPKFATPIVVRSGPARWVADRALPGVSHKYLGAFGDRRSGARLTRLAPGAKIPARVEEDAEIRYLQEGSIEYGGKTWKGGITADEGTYMWVPHGAEVGEISSKTGGVFFVISLPMLAEIDSEIRAGVRDAKGGPGGEARA
jgi:hypothetical protein